MVDPGSGDPAILGEEIRLFDLESVDGFVKTTVDNYFNLNSKENFDTITQPFLADEDGGYNNIEPI